MTIYCKKYTPGFYVYFYLRNRDSATISSGKKGTPYYVGKGQKYRAWEKHANVRTPKDKNNIIIVAEGLTEATAHAIEKVQIGIWGRINNGTRILRNKTDGGEGSTGLRHTDATKIKMSKQRQGRTPWNKGVPMSPQLISRITSANKGRPLTEAHKNKLRQKLKGRPRSQEVCQKIKAALLKRFTQVKPKLQSPRNNQFRLQCSERVKGSHYWNNGIEMKRSVECPGPGFVRGRLDTGAKYWNNGTIMKKSAICPRRRLVSWYAKERWKILEQWFNHEKKCVVSRR